MNSSISHNDERRLVNNELEMVWKGVIVLNLRYCPAICLETLMKTIRNNSPSRNLKQKI
jgi:hypothetical protein